MMLFAKKKKTVSVAVLVAVVLFVIAAVGSTMAYLHAETGAVENTMVMAKPGVPEITEVFVADGTVKKNVQIQIKDVENAAPSYVRAIVTFGLADENGFIVATVPAVGTDYTIEWGDASDWTNVDGFWYYSGIVAPGASTSDLIKSCTTLNTEYQLVVTIAAQSIQAAPVSAVQEQWGYVPGTPSGN